MQINRHEFLGALSLALDFLEIGIREHTTNHNRRVSLISVYLGETLRLNKSDCFDLSAYALLHDNGFTYEIYRDFEETGKSKLEFSKAHCIRGEENLKPFPFIKKRDGILLYHHEHYDGSGFFGLSGKDIPLFSQIIALADIAERLYHDMPDTRDIERELSRHKGTLYAPDVVDAFLEVNAKPSFWLSLHDLFVEQELRRRVPEQASNMSYEELLSISEIMSSIIDAKSPFTARHSSGLTAKCAVMAAHYGYDRTQSLKLRIAAGLHDVGKLVVPNSILDKDGRLTAEEYRVIQSHTFYTRKVLEKIEGWEDITDWASNHHEKLNGSGYPYGFSAPRLDFNSRLMSCLDIYQALTEQRPYRQPMEHAEVSELLSKMARDGLLDKSIVSEIVSLEGKL